VLDAGAHFIVCAHGVLQPAQSSFLGRVALPYRDLQSRAQAPAFLLKSLAIVDHASPLAIRLARLASTM
jgi:hypothetical protein